MTKLEQRVERAQKALGKDTAEMLCKVHENSLWTLENIGVSCKQPEIREAYSKFEKEELAFIYEDRIFITSDLVEKCLKTVPGINDFFVPMNSFFIGGTAPYIYDDEKKEGGVIPTEEHAKKIALIAQKNDVIKGMGRGIKLKDEAKQIDIMAENCKKPLYFAITNKDSLEKAKKLYKERGNVMAVFCLTRSPLQVNENLSDQFVEVAKSGIPLFISAMPMAGISAPYSYDGVLTMTHSEVLFGICSAQLLNKGTTCVHAGFPTIADPRIEYNPNYGTISHNMLNICMSHLNYILDIPSFQSAGTTHEEHLTEKAFNDAKMGQALCKKYGVHMIRHPFSFLRYLIDFSIEKLEKSIDIAKSVTAEDAPEVKMPVYDERSIESIQNLGSGMYKDDPLTTANIDKIFLE